MKRQPKCPTLNEVTESLKILGVPQDSIEPLEDRILVVIIDGWKTNKRCPTVTNIARMMKQPRPAVNSAISRLVDQNRLFRTQRGIYVPNMIKRPQQ